MPIVLTTTTSRAVGTTPTDSDGQRLPGRESSQWRRTAYRRQDIAPIDPTARIEGRAALEERLVTEFKRAQRQASLLRLIVFGFHHHSSLTESDCGQGTIAQACRQSLGDDCFLARYRSDQYCAVQVDLDVESAFTLARPFMWPVDHAGELCELPSIALAVGLPRWGGCSYERFLAYAEEAIEATRTLSAGEIHLASCLDDRDRVLLHEVSRRRFSRYLASRANFDAEILSRALREAVGPTASIGRLARKMRWLGPRRLRAILHRQRNRRILFGQAAVEMGYLTEDQVFCLLALQQENPGKLAYSLVEQGAWRAPEAQKEVKEYYANLRGGVGLLRPRSIMGGNPP